MIHDTPTKVGWRYSQNPKIVIGTDGTSFELVCSNELPDLQKAQSASQGPECWQNGITKDDPGDPEYYEALVMDIPFQTFADFGNSESLRVQIGSASFEVPAETVSAFHYFAEVMKPNDLRWQEEIEAARLAG